jgi:hypothetical protein
MAQTAAQKKAAALKKAAAAALKRAQAADDNSSEIAATARRRAVIDTAPTPEPAPVVSNTPRLDAVKAATAARVAADAALKESTKPADLDNPPAGTYYQWHVFAGGGGEWRLIKTGSFGGVTGNGAVVGGGDVVVGGGDNAVVVGDTTIKKVIDPAGPSTNITVLKSLLSSLGYSKTLVDSSTQYFMSLIAEGLDYDNIVSLYTDAKDYTLKSGQKVTSPFYEQYGYLNEGLTQPKSAADLFQFVEGTKNLIKSYNISSKFAEPDALKKYIANNVTVEKLDERIMSAKLRTITADPQYVNTLRQLKYINNSEDLTDFFLDPKIGEAQLEINRKTASFATEAMRRADKGISFNADALTRNAATLISQGRSEAQIADIANQGYETIGQVLQPSVGLSNIFEGANAANAQTIQTELEAEQFLGLESARRKKLKELGTNIFKQSTGMSTGRTVSYSNYSSAGQI